MKIIATTAAVALVSFPAFAGGLGTAPTEPMIAEPVPQTFVADTDWSGAYAGAQLGYGDVGGSGGLLDTGSEGVIGGLYGGYLYDFGRFVMGGELSISGADLEAPGASLSSLTQLKLKAGYDAGRTLIYGTAGAAYGDGEIAGVGANDFGYTVGVGVDYLVTDRITVGGEVTYSRFDDFDDTGVDLDVTTVSAKVGYRF